MPDERPAYDSFSYYVGAHGRLRLTGRATLAAAKMETDSPTLHYGIHAIDAAARSEDTFVRRNARGIFVAPAAKMYKAYQANRTSSKVTKLFLRK